MLHIDEFESRFKSSIKEPYRFEAVSIENVLFVSDLDAAQADELLDSVRRLVPAVPGRDGESDMKWTVFSAADYHSVRHLLERIEELKPDVIISQRNLKAPDENLVYGLSAYVDALTQVCSSPVLLLPDHSFRELKDELTHVRDVMVETSHLTGDNHLINWGVRFAHRDDTLYLTHIEDDAVFDYYIDVISKIPEIDTDIAEAEIRKKLLQLPSDFIDTARAVLAAEVPAIRVEGIVQLGHRLSHYADLLEKHEIDLLVINTKTEGQLAMGGIAYAIAVEFKHKPLLLL